MSILVVDDSRTQLYLITAILSSGGYSDLLAATSARQAFDHLELDAAGPGDCPVDLIILDLDMPEVDGLEAVRRIKAVERLRDIPIIIITACSDATTLQAAFAAGAMDYITKPPNAIEMLARVHSALRLKQEIDQRKAREASLVNLNQNLEHILTLLDHEREKSERLLLNILPSAVAVRLKDGATDMVVADHFPEASVMFIDVVSFTSFASRVTPTMLVMHLNRLFTYIDGLVKQHGLEKIKTTGDAYLVAGGVPTPRPGHLEAMADLALELQQALANIAITPVEGGPPGVKSLKVRIGLHVGPVVGGVIGEERFTYDIWGDTVNVASRMQSACLPRQIVTTAQVYQRLNGRYTFEPLGLIPIKGKGKLEAYRLMGKAAAGS